MFCKNKTNCQNVKRFGRGDGVLPASREVSPSREVPLMLLHALMVLKNNSIFSHGGTSVSKRCFPLSHEVSPRRNASLMHLHALMVFQKQLIFSLTETRWPQRDVLREVGSIAKPWKI